MTRFLLLVALIAAPALSAQSLPDWARPSAPSAADVPPPAMVPDPPNPPTGVPVDGGLALLALAGAGLAARKLRAS